MRVYGNTAVATYKDTYDILIMGQHRAHTIIATDTFACQLASIARRSAIVEYHTVTLGNVYLQHQR